MENGKIMAMIAAERAKFTCKINEENFIKWMRPKIERRLRGEILEHCILGCPEDYDEDSNELEIFLD